MVGRFENVRTCKCTVKLMFSYIGMSQNLNSILGCRAFWDPVCIETAVSQVKSFKHKVLLAKHCSWTHAIIQSGR